MQQLLTAKGRVAAHGEPKRAITRPLTTLTVQPHSTALKTLRSLHLASVIPREVYPPFETLGVL